MGSFSSIDELDVVRRSKRRESVNGDSVSDAWPRPENDRIGSLGLHQRRIRGRPLKRRKNTTSTAADSRLMDNITHGMPFHALGIDGEAKFAEGPQSVRSFSIELGMEFDSDEHAISYYNKYARSIGFSARKEYTNRNKSGHVTSRKITCFKEGYRRKDRRDVFVKHPRKDTRTGCLAHIVIMRDQSNGKYRVTSFEAAHNHPLAPKGTEHMLPSQKKKNKVQTHEVPLADDIGAHPNPSPEFVAPRDSRQNFLGYTDKDQRTYLHTKHLRGMRLGEANSLLHYFENRRLDDPSFYFSIQLDVDDSLTNAFWADAKMVVDYKDFGDVMSFDTTYIANVDYRPLVLFVGMNHFRKMVIFGTALMYDETIESFKWLFETFLKAMSGRKPKSILTDLSPTIAKAISLVMPEAYHRLCLWHMGQNALKHLNHVFRGSDSFAKDFYKCIYQFEEEKDFLNAWEVMLDRYDLRYNDWLREIFASRDKWSMVYGRSSFSAGMRSTQLSKCFHGALKDYLRADMDLDQFFEHFERAVDNKRYKELEASYDTTQRIPRLKVELPLLIHARDIYTSVMFEMFQDEWVKSLLVVINSCMEDSPCFIYKVSTTAHPQEYTVIAKPSDVIVSCSCNKFESLGILCSHALKILDIMSVKTMIPSQYILKRWTKDARAVSVNGADIGEDPAQNAANRYRNLCPTFLQIASRASESIQGYELAAKYANELAAKLETISKTEFSNEAPLAPADPSTALEGSDFGHNQMSMVASLFE